MVLTQRMCSLSLAFQECQLCAKWKRIGQETVIKVPDFGWWRKGSISWWEGEWGEQTEVSVKSSVMLCWLQGELPSKAVKGLMMTKSLNNVPLCDGGVSLVAYCPSCGTDMPNTLWSVPGNFQARSKSGSRYAALGAPKVCSLVISLTQSKPGAPQSQLSISCILSH